MTTTIEGADKMKITKQKLKQIIKEELARTLNENTEQEDPVEIMNSIYVGKDKVALQQALKLYEKRVMTQKPGDSNYDPIALKMYHLLQDYINKGTFKGMIK